MLKRKVDTYLKEWKEHRKTALLITGARQIGKTFSIHHFAENNFKHVIELNFANRTDLIDAFAQIKNSDQLLVRLSIIAGENLVPNETLIFFDEIQLLYQRRDKLKKTGLLDLNTQDIVTAMKSLVLDGKYRYILSGSLLGVTIKDVVLNPAGYMDEYKMYPLDFEEYLWARSVGKDAISYVKDCFEKIEKVDEPVNKLFLDYFKEYVLVGGMPESVSIFVDTKNVSLVQRSQEQVVNAYSYDITSYINDDDRKMRVKEIYNAIPSELNSRNKRFISSHVIERTYLKRNDISDEYLWLTAAGIAIPVYNVTEATLPLRLASQRKILKLFMSDIGLLDSMLFSTGIREKLLNNDININYGAPYENVAAQELYAHGFDEKLFYYNSKKNGEVDFLIEYNSDVLPIEIKSGKPDEMVVYNHSALNNLLKTYDISKAFVFGECNIEKENEKIYQFPIYMISFLSK